MGTIGGSLANNDPAADWPAAVLGARRDGAAPTSARSPPTISSRACTRRRSRPTRSSRGVAFRCRRRPPTCKFPNPASRFALVGVFVAQTGGGRARRGDRRRARRVPRAGAGGGAREELHARTRRRRSRSTPKGLNGDLHGVARVSRAPDSGAGRARGRGRGLDAAPICYAVGWGGVPSARFFCHRTPQCPTSAPASVDAVGALLDGEDYVADRRLATSVFLALKMGRPLFLEGEAGVGKTEIAKVLATASASGSSGCSATKGSTSRRPSTNGTTRGR